MSFLKLGWKKRGFYPHSSFLFQALVLGFALLPWNTFAAPQRLKRMEMGVGHNSVSNHATNELVSHTKQSESDNEEDWYPAVEVRKDDEDGEPNKQITRNDHDHHADQRTSLETKQNEPESAITKKQESSPHHESHKPHHAHKDHQESKDHKTFWAEKEGPCSDDEDSDSDKTAATPDKPEAAASHSSDSLRLKDDIGKLETAIEHMNLKSLIIDQDHHFNSQESNQQADETPHNPESAASHISETMQLDNGVLKLETAIEELKSLIDDQDHHLNSHQESNHLAETPHKLEAAASHISETDELENGVEKLETTIEHLKSLIVAEDHRLRSQESTQQAEMQHKPEAADSHISETMQLENDVESLETSLEHLTSLIVGQDHPLNSQMSQRQAKDDLQKVSELVHEIESIAQHPHSCKNSEDEEKTDEFTIHSKNVHAQDNGNHHHATAHDHDHVIEEISHHEHKNHHSHPHEHHHLNSQEPEKPEVEMENVHEESGIGIEQESQVPSAAPASLTPEYEDSVNLGNGEFGPPASDPAEVNYNGGIHESIQDLKHDDANGFWPEDDSWPTEENLAVSSASVDMDVSENHLNPSENINDSGISIIQQTENEPSLPGAPVDISSNELINEPESVPQQTVERNQDEPYQVETEHSEHHHHHVAEHELEDSQDQEIQPQKRRRKLHRKKLYSKERNQMNRKS